MKTSRSEELPAIFSLLILALAAMATGYIYSLAEDAFINKPDYKIINSYEISSKRLQDFLSFSHYCEYKGGNPIIETFEKTLIFHCDYDNGDL